MFHDEFQDKNSYDKEYDQYFRLMEIELLDNYIQFIEWKYIVNFTSQKIVFCKNCRVSNGLFAKVHKCDSV